MIRVLPVINIHINHGKGEIARLVRHAGDRAEGDDVQTAIHGAELDGTDGKMLHNAAEAAQLHHITDRNRIFKQQKNAGDHILYQALAAEADRDADHTGAGDQWCDIHADFREYG